MIEWNVLNIEETTDEQIITEAYRRMLTVTNPEDNPQGFMLLRSTYEAALQYARDNNSFNNSFPMENTNDMTQDLDKTIVIDNIKDIIKKKVRPEIDDTMHVDIANMQVNNNINYDDNSMGNLNVMSNNFHEDNGVEDGNGHMDDENYQHESQQEAQQDVQHEIQQVIQEDVQHEELPPLEEWMRSVESVYYNFEQRISEDVWKQILSNNVCIELDYKMDASEALLHFLMKHYYLPQRIWVLIDGVFDYSNNRKELIEKFPKNFIDDVVISSINYPDIINYDLFISNLSIDYDQFISKYFEIVKHIREGELEDAYMSLCEIDAFGAVHPYVEVERVKYFINMGELEQAQMICNMLIEQFPQDAAVIYICAEIAWAMADIPKAKLYYKQLLDINSNHYYGRLGLADCYMQEEKYEKAKDLYTQLIEINSYDVYVQENIDIANKKLIQLFENKLKKKPEDVKIKVKLAWCYLQNEDVDKAIMVGKEMEVNGDPYEYCNILGKCFLHKKDYRNAIKYFEKWVECIRNIPRNGKKENKIKYSRLGQALEVLGQSYELAQEEKKALNLYRMAKKEEPKNINHRIMLARYLLKLGKNEDCIIECNSIIEKDKRNFDARYYKAVALFNQEYFSKALDAFDDCLQIYRYDVNCYVYKIRIHLKYCEYDKVKEIFEFLDNECIGSDAVTFYKNKMEYDKEVLELTKKGVQNLEEEIDYEYYLNIYEGLLNNYKNNNSDITEPTPLYIEMANLYVHIGEYKRSLATLKNVHEKDKNNIEVYECMAISLEKLGEYKAALETYKRMLVLCPDHKEANIKIAELLEKQEDYEEAIKFHTKQLEITKSIPGLLRRGKIYLKMDEFDLARKDFKEALKMNPYNPNSYNNIGLTYLYQGNYEEAKQAFDKAIERLEQEPTPEPYRNLALVYSKLMKFDEAIECYEKNASRFNEAYDLEKIAEIYYEQKEYKKSVEAYSKRCKMIKDPDELTNTELYVWVGKCNTGLKSEKTALKYYTKAIETAKVVGVKCFEAYIEIARMYMDIGKYELAMKFYNEIKTSEAMKIEDKLDYARCCFEAKNFDEGKKYASNCLKEIDNLSEKQSGKMINKYYLKGYAYVVLNNLKEAQDCVNRAFKCRTCNECNYPKCHKIIALQGLIFDRAQNPKGALKCLSDALLVVPGNSKYIHEMSRIKEKYNYSG